MDNITMDSSSSLALIQLHNVNERNELLEEKIAANQKELRYWKDLNKSKVLQLRQIRKEFNSYVSTADEYAQKLNEQTQHQNNVIKAKLQQLQDAKLANQVVQDIFRESREEKRAEAKAVELEFQVREEGLIAKIASLELTVAEQNGDIDRLEKRVGEFEAMQKKCNAGELEYKKKETAYRERCQEIFLMKLKLEDVQRKILKQEVRLENGEAEIQKKLQNEIAKQQKKYNKFRNVFKRKGDRNVAVTAKTVAAGKMGDIESGQSSSSAEDSGSDIKQTEDVIKQTTVEIKQTKVDMKQTKGDNKFSKKRIFGGLSFTRKRAGKLDKSGPVLVDGSLIKVDYNLAPLNDCPVSVGHKPKWVK